MTTSNCRPAAPITLGPEEWSALVTLVADVHDGRGLDRHVQVAAGAAWRMLSRRCVAAAGVAEQGSRDQERACLDAMANRPRPWWPPPLSR
jgi:hypothetical protein